MKKIALSIFAFALALPTLAQLTGDGYYRVQNFKSNRYLSIDDCSDARIGATQIDLSDIIGYNGFERVEWDATTVIYIQNKGGLHHDLYGQGIWAESFTNIPLSIKPSNQPGTYEAYGTYAGATVYLSENTQGGFFGINWDDGFPISDWKNTFSEGVSLRYWYIRPINQNANSDFGLKPYITIGSNYYMSFYAAFPFTPASDMEVYYVTRVDKQYGIAVYKRITGNVPQGTPVIVKCASPTPANNKLTLLPPGSVTALSDNMMTGVYWDRSNKGDSRHQRYTEYNPEGMRVLGTTADGKLGLVKADKTNATLISYHATSYFEGDVEKGPRDLYTIPKNTGYLGVSSDCPADLTLMTEAEYEAYRQSVSTVTLKANDASRLYGDANPTFTYTVTEGTKNGGEPTLSCSATATSPVGTYPIVIAKGGVTNGTVNLQNGTLTVNKAPLTITARSYTIKQNEALPTFAADFSGFKNGETNSVLTAQPTLSCNVPADKKPGTYTITATGATAQNYNITYVAGTLTINEADPITVKAVSATMAYGDEVPQLTYTIEGGTLNGTPKVVCSATKTSDVGEYDITIDVSGISYPNLKTVNGKLTITKAPLDVTAKSYTIVETEALPTFEATISGWKNGQDATVLTKQPTFTCNVPADKAPGSYPITVGGAEAKNYSFTYTNGMLTVTQAPTITIRAAAKSMVYGDDVPELTYTVEGGTLNGTPVLATTATKTSNVGEYDITITKGDITYPRLNLVGSKLTVTKAMLTVSAGTYTMKQNEQRPTFQATYSGWKNNDTEAVLTKKPTLTTNAPANNTPGTYDVTVSGAEAQNYDFTYVAGKLVITSADAITVTVEDATMVYGNAVPQFKYTISGGTVTGEPVITCEATSTSPVGEYVIKVEKGTISYPNLVLTNGKLTITQAPLTIKAGSYTMKQNEQRPEFKATFEGFKNEETEAVLTKQPVFTTNAPEDNKPGEYEVSVSGAEAKNYAITYVAGTLKITEADLITITAKNATMTYGDAVPTLTFTVEGGTLTGTQPTVSCEATSKSDAGTYTIKVDATGVNYPNLKLVDGTLTIDKATLTVSVGDYERFQGEQNPDFKLTYEGWRNDDTEAALTVKPTATCEATVDSPVGSYAIIVSGGEAKNYSFTYKNGTLTINEGQGIATLILSRPADVYTTTGRKVRTQATTLQGLPAGVYIVNGRKLVVK